jgi:4-amino-4-deoxychorismate lyase
MVKFYELNYTYDYSFPAVTLAYFLRYPNPYSTHVLSTDVISRSIDPTTGRLSTTRIHIKRSRLPPAILKLLPSSVLGSVSAAGSSSSYVLERSTIDIREGWMETESRNLDWTGILSVVERQSYRRDLGSEGDAEDVKAGTTDVTTSIKFRSRLGERVRARARRGEGEAGRDGGRDVEEEPKKGFLANWSTSGIQRSIEAIASRRTLVSQGKSKEGMNVVLERLRHGGLWGALEGMRRDREAIFGHEGCLKPAWKNGDGDEGDQPRIDE